MFILKRQDVEISTVQHPTRDQKVPILHYQGQTFRLISVFKASQEVEAKTLWRSLTDNRGKACVLLEEPERFSVWGKIRWEQLDSDTGSHNYVTNYQSGDILEVFWVFSGVLFGMGAALEYEASLSLKRRTSGRKRS